MAKENVGRLANKMGYQISEEEAEQNFRLLLTPTAAEEQVTEEPATVAGDTVVFCGSNQMGQGDIEFGQILLKNFITTLLELNPLPDKILFVNSGAAPRDP